MPAIAVIAWSTDVILSNDMKASLRGDAEHVDAHQFKKADRQTLVIDSRTSRSRSSNVVGCHDHERLAAY